MNASIDTLAMRAANAAQGLEAMGEWLEAYRVPFDDLFSDMREECERKLWAHGWIAYRVPSGMGEIEIAFHPETAQGVAVYWGSGSNGMTHWFNGADASAILFQFQNGV